MFSLNNWGWDSCLDHSTQSFLLFRYIIVMESVPSLGCFDKVPPIPRVLGIHSIDLFFVEIRRVEPEARLERDVDP